MAEKLHRQTNLVCSELVGMDSDITSRTLNGFDDWLHTQPVGVMGESRKDRKAERKAKQAAYNHIVKTQFASFGIMTWISVAVMIWKVIAWIWNQNRPMVRKVYPRK